MISETRTKKMEEVARQVEFIEMLFETLRAEMKEGFESQNKDPWYDYDAIRNHTQHANDVRYIRRQLLRLQKMLEEP